MTQPDTTLATKVARAELMKRVLIVVTAVMVMVLLVSQAVLISQIRATQQTGSPVLKAIIGQQDDIEIAAKSAASTNDQLLDCLQPEGECYKESQRQRADFGRLQVLAVVCATGTDIRLPFGERLRLVNECVADGLAKPS